MPTLTFGPLTGRAWGPCRAALIGLVASLAVLAVLALLATQAALAAQAADAPVGAASAPASASPATAPPAAGVNPDALLPVEMFFRHPDIGSAKLSPSGRRLAITLNVRERLGLAVIDLQGSEPPKLVLRDDQADIRSFDWVNDERLVFSLIQLDAGSRDQDFGPGLFSIGLDGGTARMLVRVRRDVVRERRIGQEPLERNHSLLAVPAGGQGDEVVVGQLRHDATGEFDSVLPLRLNVVSGRSRSLGLGMPDKVKRWLFDPQGEPRVAFATHQGETIVYWRAPGTERWQELVRHPTHRWPYQPHSVDSAGQLFVLVNERGGAGIDVLRRFDFKTGQPEAEALARTPGFDFHGDLVYDAADPQRLSEGALGLRLTTDAETTVWFKPRLAALQQVADQRLPGRINRLSCRRCEADDAVVLVESWSDQDPGQLWLHKPASAQWQRIGLVRKDVEPSRMARLDLHRFKARDGLEIPVWITQPRALPGPAAPRPAVLLVHGGPWVRGNTWHWSGEAQFLASRGYVVIEPEFRSSTGYGSKLYSAGFRQWGRAMQDDLVDTVRWAAKQGWVDDKRVCIAGASYGGYATLMGLVRDPEIYRCGIAWLAVSDPRLMFQWAWDYDVGEEGRNFEYPLLIGDPVADAAMLTDIAPITHAARIRTPLLLAHGQQDHRVPVLHANRLREAMAAAGHPPEWVLYDDEGHGWLRPANRYDFARRMERFLAQQLGPAAR